MYPTSKTIAKSTLVWNSRSDSNTEWKTDYIPMRISRLNSGKRPHAYVLDRGAVNIRLAAINLPAVEPAAPDPLVYPAGAAGQAALTRDMLHYDHDRKNYDRKFTQRQDILDDHSYACTEMLSCFENCAARDLLVENFDTAIDAVTAFRNMDDALIARFSPFTPSNAVSLRSKLHSFRDKDMPFTDFERHFKSTVLSIRACNDPISDLDVAAVLLTPNVLTNPAFITYRTLLHDDHEGRIGVFTWERFFSCSLSLANSDTSINNYHQQFRTTMYPPSISSIYNSSLLPPPRPPGSRGIPTTVPQCNRCGKTGHFTRVCTSTFCSLCHTKIDGNFHNIKSQECNQVFSLGLSPGARGSAPFSPNPPPPLYPPRNPPIYRGGGRYAANLRLRQPILSTPQARHAANLANQVPPSTAPTTSQSAYAAEEEEYAQWHSTDDPDYHAFMAAHVEAAAADAHSAYVSQLEVDDETAFHSATMSGVKRDHDEI